VRPLSASPATWVGLSSVSLGKHSWPGLIYGRWQLPGDM
jgi:hypothetical protein